MLLTRTANTFDEVYWAALLLQSCQDKVYRLNPHSHGRIDFALILVRLHALDDLVLGGKISVEVDLGFGNDLEVRSNYNCYSPS